MAYEHCNGRGEAYLLQAGKTRTGKSRYYFGRTLTGELVEQVPGGYEVFESPERAQVYLRKGRRSGIAPIEREILIEGIRRPSTVAHFLVNVEEDCMVVYPPTRSVDEANDLVRTLVGRNALQLLRYQQARDELVRESDFEKMMRFKLVDTDQRLFQVDRWWFRSSRDCWIPLGKRSSLSELIELHAEHLGQESFYELF